MAVMSNSLTRSRAPPQLEEPVVDSQSERVVEGDNVVISTQADMVSTTIIHSVLVLALVAVVVGILNAFGIVVRSSTSCPDHVGYSMCHVWQDFRSLLSFLVGALLCSVLTRGQQDNAAEESPARQDKVQLYYFLL